jgi:cytochrome b involved in lipid metabolism
MSSASTGAAAAAAPPCAACTSRWAAAEAATAAAPSRRRTFTLCDLARENAANASAAPGSARVWLYARGRVFAVPVEWAMRVHPGGANAVLSHAGVDSTTDFDFHSEKARRKWSTFAEGKLVNCDARGAPAAAACSIA